MSLTINHNLMTMNAARNLASAFDTLNDSVRRLSSGLRISRSADDAAGLAVRELMRSEIAGMHQGVRNANDAISLIQTADGALQVIDEKLIRMKELAEQAATGTYNSDQRLIIDSEYQAMASEITRIADATDFNGIYLLNGNLSGIDHDGSGLKSTGMLKVHFGTANDCAEDYYYIRINSATSAALGLSDDGGLVGATEAEYVEENGLSSSASNALALYVAGVSGEPGYWSTDFDQTQTVNTYTKGNVFYLFATRDNGDLYVLQADNSNGNFISDQVIASPGSYSISTQEAAQQTLVKIDDAIVSKDKIRANLGALENRLQNTITNMRIQAENLQIAESRISDADMSKEMTEFVSSQILSSSAVSMLAQANALPRMALQLLAG
mgnify:CR=1 FL=1